MTAIDIVLACVGLVLCAVIFTVICLLVLVTICWTLKTGHDVESEFENWEEE